MKFNLIVLFAGIFFMTSCSKKGGHEHHESEATSDDPNEALYIQVMAIHDEVMPKMDDLYRLKKELQDKISSSKELTVDKKEQLKQIISSLDSADHLMMNWMHKFKPLPDSAGQEAAREYLENEMEEINKVKELTNESVQKAKTELGLK